MNQETIFIGVCFNIFILGWGTNFLLFQAHNWFEIALMFPLTAANAVLAILNARKIRFAPSIVDEGSSVQKDGEVKQ